MSRAAGSASTGVTVADLVPPPRSARPLDSAWRPGGRLTLAPSRLLGASLLISPALTGLRALGFDIEQAQDADVRLEQLASMPTEGYRLRIDANGVDIETSGVAGARHALATLCQWLRLHAAKRRGGAVGPIGGLQVEDWPSFAARGVMLDISRNRVPRLSILERLIDLLAELKINQLQLYMEHTFAYRGHGQVWRDASPLTAADVQRLDGYCRARGIELVPNQNSFGHLHRWLVHEPYRQLAECPDGIEHPFGRRVEPFSLCATDTGSVELLRDLYDQLLPNFADDGDAGGRLFNTGLDETLDLGRCRSEQACAERGKDAVYLEFLHQVHALCAEHGRRMQCWADVLLGQDALEDDGPGVAQVPDDVVPLIWGYEADHPFDRQCARLARHGHDYYVCPGTSSWSSFAGRTDNAVRNLASAAVAGRGHGAAGYLITDWGDHGHLQPLPISYPGLVAGAAFAWNASVAQAAADDSNAVPLARWLDCHVFHDRAGVLGRLACDLGNLHQTAGSLPINGSALFFALHFASKPAAERRGDGISRFQLERCRRRLSDILEPLASATPDRDDADLLAAEYRWVADVSRFAIDFADARLEIGNDRSPSELPGARRRQLRMRLAELAARMRPLWLLRSRPGGLDDSVARLTAVDELLAG